MATLKRHEAVTPSVSVAVAVTTTNCPSIDASAMMLGGLYVMLTALKLEDAVACDTVYTNIV
jgi:hypothetical protein